MSNCLNCGNHGVRDGEYCDCVMGVQAKVRSRIDELRRQLFAELETMSREDMIRDLEEAGFVIRYDIEGGGVILNPDGTVFKWRESEK